ncbi:hypothetical protein LBMAG53_24050 [Planctomycetota bacterium]|nr:hypothetical protein LBMAG53_24050 [Planctomycetota bacterium]
MRICLFMATLDQQLIGAIEHYRQQHDLPWQLQVIDRKEAFTQVHDVDGILLGSYAPLPSWWSRRRVPCVRWRGIPEPGVTVVYWDDAAIGRLAARHFREQGFRYVATVSKPLYAGFGGFREAATAAGLTFLRFDPTAGDADHGVGRLITWLRAAPHPLGIFCHQDRPALWLLELCREHGVRVPDEIGVLGVDDLEISAVSMPPLSSIQIPSSAIGMAMAIHLHRLLSGASAPSDPVPITPTRVSVRKSTMRDTGDAVIDRLCNYLASKPAAAHSGPALAKRAGLSLPQLHRRFRKALGLTPAEQIRRYRLRLAQDLLADTDQTVAAIGRRCGLGGTVGLWRLFRAAGLPSPDRWRAMTRGVPDDDHHRTDSVAIPFPAQPHIGTAGWEPPAPGPADGVEGAEPEVASFI